MTANISKDLTFIKVYSHHDSIQSILVLKLNSELYYIYNKTHISAHTHTNTHRHTCIIFQALIQNEKIKQEKKS